MGDITFHPLGAKYIGLEEAAADLWAVFFGSVSFGWLHARKSAILDYDGFASVNPKLSPIRAQ